MDQHGFLWVATQNGIYRFLGARFQRMSANSGILEQDVNDVYAAPDGHMWAGTAQNLFHWTGEGFQPAAPTPIPISDSHGLAAEKPGEMLVVSAGELNRLAYGPDGKFIAYGAVIPEAVTASRPYLHHIASVTVLPDGAVWMGCGGRLCAWRSGKLEDWGPRQGVPEDEFRSLLYSRDGSLWAVGQRHILERPRGASMFLDRTAPGVDASAIYERAPAAVDSEGRILVSAEGGVARWASSHWRGIGEREGLKSSHITALLFDANGDLWLGSTGHGLHHWTGYEHWEGWSERQGLPSAIIWSVGLFDRGNAYIGTAKGIARIDLSTGRVNSSRSRPQWGYGQVRSLARDRRGVLWAGTMSGAVLRVSPDTLGVARKAQLHAYVYKLMPDPDGLMFALTDKGVYRLGDTPSPTPRSIADLAALFGGPVRVFNGCTLADGTSWFLTGEGLVQLRRGAWSRPVIAGLEPHRPLPRYMSNCTSTGTFWLAGDQDQLWRVTTNDGHPRATPLALPTQYHSIAVVGIQADPRGWLWLGTDSGLLAWNGSTWRNFTQESGLIWNDVNSDGVALAPDGSVWIGTSGGLGHIAHPEQVFDTAPPQVSMVGIQRDDQSLSLAKPLSWSRSDLSFHFATPSALDRSQLLFRYRIPQLQSGWTQTRDGTAHFFGLPGGHYTFEVEALNIAEDASSAILSVGFSILPPWWNTIWFYGVCGGAITILLFMLYRLRTQEMVRQRRQLEDIVRDRTRALEASEEKLRIQATHDGLTGLLNRTAILAQLESEMERVRRGAGSLLIVLVDLDHFKSINDSHGHLAGDEALRTFAAALRVQIRPCDHVGRYGGEEFIVVLTGVQTSDVCARVASLHGSTTNLVVRHGDSQFIVTCSMGAVHIGPQVGPVAANAVVEAADKALYQAKRAGRNQFAVVTL